MASRNTAFTLAGEKELQRRLSSLGKQSTVNRMARPALREASGEIRKAAKRFAPVRTGLLRKSIKNVVRTSKKTQEVYAVVGPAVGFKTTYMGEPQDPAKYAHLVEFGTDPHPVAPKSGGVLAFWGSDGVRRYVGGGFIHPGTPPRPFLRPAYDSVNSQRIIARRLGKELDKEAAKRR